jgi:hypothetical protein
MAKCDNIINNQIGFLDNICPYWKYNNGMLINKYNKTHIVPQYLSLNTYDTKHINNICTLCEVCWRNRYDNIRKLYPSNKVTDNIKLEFLYKVKPHLIIGDTIYRQMKINNINRGIYTYDEIDKGCSIMDIDNDLFT